jgi:hypothetical protein
VGKWRHPRWRAGLRRSRWQRRFRDRDGGRSPRTIRELDGLPFFLSIAGISVSLAGFAALIAWLREDSSSWDPINLWRVQTIVRHALTLAFLTLALTPVYSLTEDMETTIRAGSLFLILAHLYDLFKARDRDPVLWVPPSSWWVFIFTGAALIGLQAVNLWVASLGLLQIGLLAFLTSPAGIFYNFVRELGAPATEPA